MEEGKQINKQVGCELERTGDMVDRLSSIVAHDKWIVGKGASAVGTQFVETAYPCPQSVVIIHDEHERFLHERHRWSEIGSFCQECR